MGISEELNSIKPVEHSDVIDIVEAAGIDVHHWGVRKDGSPSQSSRANPTHVYEWAFGGGNEPILLCIWHESLKADGDQIVYEDTIRSLAAELDRIATEPRSDPGVKTRARSQAARARKFDLLAQEAFRRKRPVRVVVLEGSRRDERELGKSSSQVEYRFLDPENWWVHSYDDDSGLIRLVRREPPSEYLPSNAVIAEDYLDALDDLIAPPPGNHHPEKLFGTTSGFRRDDAVREHVRKRSKGFCELCMEPGFMLPDGTRYIETHHLIWLSEGGPDTPENVIALCANHHREVHYGNGRVELERKMWARLIELGVLKHMPTLQAAS